jgi:glycosyltransferase involved in cell wall biosynthesis
MRIAYFTDTFLPRVDGVSSTVFEHSQSLARRGHQVFIYAPKYPNHSLDNHIDNITIKRQPSIPFPAYEGARIPFPKTLEIYKSIKKFDPDIIHIHTPHTIGILGILIAKILKKPIIGTYHTLYSETLIYISPNILLKKLGIETQNKNFLGNKKADDLFKDLASKTINGVYNNCDLVITPSLPIKQLLIDQELKKSIEVLPTGINNRLFFRDSKYQKTGLKIIHVGRISYEKNIDIVIKSFQIILETIPQARLILVGDGPALSEIKELSKKLHIEKSVDFIGQVARTKLPHFYSQADVFVTASTMETLGLVVLEAMSCGLPIIAVNKYALPWLVKNNKNGFLVKPFDFVNMAKMTIKILADKKIASKFGRASAKYSTNYNISKIIDRLERLYKSLSTT